MFARARDFDLSSGRMHLMTLAEPSVDFPVTVPFHKDHATVRESRALVLWNRELLVQFMSLAGLVKLTLDVVSVVASQAIPGSTVVRLRCGIKAVWH